MSSHIPSIQNSARHNIGLLCLLILIMRWNKSEWEKNFESPWIQMLWRNGESEGMLGEAGMEAGRGGLGSIFWEEISMDCSISLKGALPKAVQLVWNAESLVLEVSWDPRLPFPLHITKQKSYSCCITRHWVEDFFLVNKILDSITFSCWNGPNYLPQETI